VKNKLPAILLNVDFYSKPRNKKWISEQGAEAVIVLQAFWIASSQETNCKIKKNEVTFLNFPINIKSEKVESILKSAVEVGLLEEDNDAYFNSQIVQDAESFREKRENYKKGREKREKNNCESKQDLRRIHAESTQDSQIKLGESCVDYIEYEYEPEPVLIKNINSQVEKLEFHEPDEFLKIPEPETEDEREAENQLLKPTGAEPWEKTNQFMLAGRRPFALFPQVFITRRELAAVVKAYKNAGVAHRIGEACITINARLDSWRIEGRDPQKATISAWFLGFVLTELIESETHATRLENAQKPRVPIPENQRYPRKSENSFVNNLVGNAAKTRNFQ